MDIWTLLESYGLVIDVEDVEDVEMRMVEWYEGVWKKRKGRKSDKRVVWVKLTDGRVVRRVDVIREMLKDGLTRVQVAELLEIRYQMGRMSGLKVDDVRMKDLMVNVELMKRNNWSLVRWKGLLGK